jgi:hypothetical protein
MKTQIIYTLIFLSIFIISCSKNESITEDDNFLQGMQIYKRLSMSSNLEETRLAYSSLSSSERQKMWQAKLTSKLISNSFSAEQKRKILDIKNHLTLDVFNKGDAREIFYTNWFPSWATSATKTFSNIEIYNLIFSINDISPVTNLQESPKGCICALHSTFTCPKWSVTWPLVLNFGTCKLKGTCVAKDSGCGALMDQECDGDFCPDDDV